MALPFFMLAGEVMNRGGITIRLVEFSQAFMGHLRGGLAHVNILSSILFAGLSGSAVADTSALGSTLIPAMEKNGYSRKFAAAITAASCFASSLPGMELDWEFLRTWKIVCGGLKQPQNSTRSLTKSAFATASVNQRFPRRW